MSVLLTADIRLSKTFPSHEISSFGLRTRDRSRGNDVLAIENESGEV
jgi:hypothetical protein